MSKFAGAQLSGRFSWPPQVIEAARRYAREISPENLRALDEARRKAAREIVSLQANHYFHYVTDGGVGFLDAFTPYAGGTEVGGGGGNIDKYPGTRNSYYHTPVVKGELKGGSRIKKCLYTEEIIPGKRKAILPSPASLALAAENTYYPNLEELLAAYSRVLREDVRTLEAAGYQFVQLNECFLTVDRFSKKVGGGFLDSFGGAVDRIFKDFAGRSCIYFHSGDASSLLPKVIETAVTDVGFDFHTQPSAELGHRLDKNVILGLQNATRKLPEDWLAREPEELASRAMEYVKVLGLDGRGEVFLSPSQDYDGLQTYPQAERRLDNLANAVSILGGP